MVSNTKESLLIAYEQEKRLADSLQQEVKELRNSKESLLISYKQEKGLADSLQQKVKGLHTMNDKLKEANQVFYK